MLFKGLFYNADAGAASAPGAGGATADGGTPADFDAWYKGQPDAVRAMLDGHTKGLKSALDTERDARKALEKLQKDAQKSTSEQEQKRLAEQQEFQKLAEMRQAKIQEYEATLKELEPLKTKTERALGALRTQLEAQRQGLPEHIVALLDKLDEVEQLEWLAKNQAALKTQTVAGVPQTPDPKGNGRLSDDERRKKAFRVHL